MTDPIPANKGEQRAAMFGNRIDLDPEVTDIEHAWWGLLRTSLDVAEDPNMAFHAGFRAGVVWQHNRSTK